MNELKIKIMFELLREVIGITAKIVTTDTPDLYSEMKNEANAINALGTANNLKNTGSAIFTMDLFKPENRDLLEKVKIRCNRHELNSLKFIKENIPHVFINIDLIESYHNKNQTKNHMQFEIPGWSEYPLSIRTVAAVVIVHELTHCQLDQEIYEGCCLCIKCDHCDHFYKTMRENWKKVIDGDCLRRFDFLGYGISADIR